MRHERILGEHVWYLVGTAVNIGETLFQLRWTEDLLRRVLRDAKGNYSFEMRGLKFEGSSAHVLHQAGGREETARHHAMDDELRSLNRPSRYGST
jgi:hypothetical protein